VDRTTDSAQLENNGAEQYGGDVASSDSDSTAAICCRLVVVYNLSCNKFTTKRSNGVRA